MKRGMTSISGESIFSDSQVASLRMLIAGLGLLPFALFKLRRLLVKKDFWLLLIVGLSGNFIPAFLFTYAETGISSGYAGMLNSFTPIFTLLIGFFIFNNRLTSYQIVGVVVGTIGIVLLTIAGSDLSLSGSFSHVIAVIIATLFYGISLNTIKYKLQHLKSVEITSLAFLTILVPSIIVSFANKSFQVIQVNEFAYEGLFFIAILSLIGTALAVILFNQLISTSTILFASSVTYLIPIVAVVIGFGFGENLTVFQIVSMGVVLLGVFTANILPKFVKNSSKS